MLFLGNALSYAHRLVLSGTIVAITGNGNSPTGDLQMASVAMAGKGNSSSHGEDSRSLSVFGNTTQKYHICPYGNKDSLLADSNITYDFSKVSYLLQQ